jgi:hypothetical protein
VALAQVRLERWGPYLFVNAADQAAPLADTLSDVPGQVAELGLDVDALRFHHRSEWTVYHSETFGVSDLPTRAIRADRRARSRSRAARSRSGACFPNRAREA